MRAAAVIAVALVVLACREGLPADDAAAGAAPIRFAAGDPVELIYADARARFRTARGVDAVPAFSRRAVRVVSPGQPDTDLVHFVDLTRPDPDGRFTTALMPAGELERRALAALPPGPGSRVSLAAPPDMAVATPGGVVVYGTAWCGACARLRETLDRRQVAYRFRDVERDPRAGAEMAAALAALGVQADRVPVIDVHGRLLVGFEPARLDTLLGESL